jgi:hypothetical protein
MNRYTKAMPFVMGSVGLVPAMVPERALFSSVDHKSGYHHVWVHPECWQFQGVFWKGQYYVFCVLVFGYCLSPWFYQLLSDLVTAYVRRQRVPCVSWVDDFLAAGVVRPGALVTDATLLLAARRAAFVLAATMYFAGYYVSLLKSVLVPTPRIRSLGLILDSYAREFTVPEDKRDRFLALVRHAIAAGRVGFKVLEKIHGKAASFSFAVPAAGFFTRGMQHALTAALRADPRARAMNVTVPCVGRVLVDLMEWLRLAGDLNSGPWLRPQHEGARVHSIRVESDASSRRWGAVLEVPALDGRAPSPPFQAADSFTAAEAVLPINVKEMLAVLYLVMAYVRARGSTALRGARLSFCQR